MRPGCDREDAFRASFQEFYPRLVVIASRICANQAEGEEMAQEAFLRLHSSPVLEHPADEVGAWLVRVVTNLSLNAYRSRARELARLARVSSLEAAESRAREASADPAESALRREERDRVRAVLLELPPRARACLVLRHTGLSYSEIAAALGTAPSSIGTMLARAERAFAEKWRQQDEV